MKKIVAIRLRRREDGVIAFKETQHAEIIFSSYDKRDNAVKNLQEELCYRRGMAFSVDGCDLFWFVIDDQRSVEYYLAFNEVECVLSGEWLESAKAKIAGYSGFRYYDACAAWADDITLKDQQRKIDYNLSKYTRI
ncbi:hypothetical protein SIN8267_02103 [Sinobacterium norvegicum]|uniref:Uncharacterized protein n=1 Tax=Sinobacterium norvegicum TaxID=1641715 RepID=A0ABM9AG39_9GAMM|nr:hypothetical protein [Sinobacterium norvegicum]CAH0991988.1 hypothetical protein SIN8267_02103 [Sinobacterium norvegicum]